MPGSKPMRCGSAKARSPSSTKTRRRHRWPPTRAKSPAPGICGKQKRSPPAADEKGFPSPPFRGEREGPAPKAWEGEVGAGKRSGIPHLTPALSAPPWPKGGGEGVSGDLDPRLNAYRDDL